MFCYDCGLPYGEQGFHDLIIEDWAWNMITSEIDFDILLCANCICYRLEKWEIQCAGAYLSGPIRTVDPLLFEAHKKANDYWIKRE